MKPETFNEANEDCFPDWSCLDKIDFPNLLELEIVCTIKYLVGIVQATAYLPKLKSLDVYHCREGDYRNFVLETLQYTEQLISSPLVLQLTTLRLRTSYFRLDRLTILCKYASQFKNLENLWVHSHDIEGVEMVAQAGKMGGFPNLKTITFIDMACDYPTRVYSKVGNKKISQDEKVLKEKVGGCLKKVWPNIIHDCRFDGYGSYIYGKSNYGEPYEFHVSDSEEEEFEEDEDEEEYFL